MAIEYGKCIFRIVGCLSHGYFEVEYVRAGTGPIAIREEDVGSEIRRWDEVWIREIPAELVPTDSRLPNCLVEVTARGRREIISVSPVHENSGSKTPIQSPQTTTGSSAPDRV